MELLNQHPKKVSRPVIDADIPYIKEIRGVMRTICQSPAGRYPYAYAIAHPQVEPTDPMRFFVNHMGDIYINPVITKYADKVYHKEACMSWPFRSLVKVRRHNKITIKYDLLKWGQDNVQKDVEEELEGLDAFIVQHEIGHFNLLTVYPVNKPQV